MATTAPLQPEAPQQAPTQAVGPSEAEAKEENKPGQRCSVAIEVKDHLKLDALLS